MGFLPWNICMHTFWHCVYVIKAKPPPPPTADKKKLRRTHEHIYTFRTGFTFYERLHFLYICQLLQTTNKQHVQFMTFLRINSNDRDVRCLLSCCGNRCGFLCVYIHCCCLCIKHTYKVKLCESVCGKCMVLANKRRGINMKISETICNSLDK